MLAKLDDILNRVTMYRLVTYGLSLLTIVTFVFSMTGVLDFTPLAMAASLTVIMVTGFAANQFLQRLLSIPANTESGLITCFILFFLLTPTGLASELFIAALATIIAIASKFLLTLHGKHIFNPAAFGAAIVGLLGLGHAGWWIGSSSLWPFTLVLGLLVIRKLRRSSMVFSFFVASSIVSSFLAMQHGVSFEENIRILLLSSPLIFLGTIMLTEPSTMPPRRKQRVVFAVIAGALFAWHPGAGLLYVYPETALLVANIYAFAVSPKRRWVLTFVRRTRQGKDSYDYEFRTNTSVSFKAGQYMEYTVPLPLRQVDDRGNRRTFTIASSPTENIVHVGIRIPKRSSKFKQMFDGMKSGDVIFAGQVAGDFVLPNDPSRKIIGIAGGVGVTPFRSMVKQLIDTGQKRDMVLIYMTRAKDDFMYDDVFRDAKRVGVTVEYVVAESGMTEQQLAQLVPDIKQRSVYVSGPPAMTRHTKTLVKKLGVRKSAIKTDYFAGY